VTNRTTEKPSSRLGEQKGLAAPAIAGITVGGLVVLALSAALAVCLVRRRRLKTKVFEPVQLPGRSVFELDAKASFTEMPANSDAKLVSTTAFSFAGYETPPRFGSQCPTIHELGD
jgi:hypothetical protein